MNTRTGSTYTVDSELTALLQRKQAEDQARAAGEDPNDIVMVLGTPEQVERLATAVRERAAREKARQARKRQKAARRATRAK